MAFGARLKQLRTNKGMKQSELGELLSVSHVSISGYENETRSPDPDTLAKIAEIFDVSVDNLLGVKAKQRTDLDDLLKEGSMTYGGKEISEKNLKVIAGVVRSFLDEMDEQ